MHIKDILSTEDNHNRIKLRLADKIKIIRYCIENREIITQHFIKKSSGIIHYSFISKNDDSINSLYDELISQISYKKDCVMVFTGLEGIKFNPVNHGILIIFDIKHKLFIMIQRVIIE